MKKNVQLVCELKQFDKEAKNKIFILYPTEYKHAPNGSLITLFHSHQECHFSKNKGEHINFFAATSFLYNTPNDFNKFLSVLSTTLKEIINTIDSDIFQITVEPNNADYSITMSK